MAKMDDTTKHSVNLRTGDYAAIQSYLRGKPIHASDIIRQLVADYVDKVIGQTPIDYEKLSKVEGTKI